MALLSPHTKPKKLTSWQDSEHIPQSGVPPNVIPFGYFKKKKSFLGKASRCHSHGFKGLKSFGYKKNLIPFLFLPYCVS